MKSALDILRGELERLFSNASIKELCSSFLGVDPVEAGLYDEVKSVFARRLVEWCRDDKSTEALADAVAMMKKGMVDPRVKQIYEERFPVEDIKDGTDVAGFTIKRKLGDGGLGSVYEALREEDEEKQQYAVKVIRAEHALDIYAARRFTTYMRILGTIEHPAIPHVAYAGHLEDGRPVVITHWVEGKPLAEFKPMPVLEALAVFETILGALDEIHGRSLVHADLNLHNIIIRNGDKDDGAPSDVALLGFGVNRLFFRAEPRAGESFRSYGRFNGLSPEQARGKPADVRSDIYAMGAVLYELVAGRPVFSERTPIDLVAAHLKNRPTPVSEVCSDPAASVLDDLIAKLMAKEPTGRPQNVDEVRKMLEGVRREAEAQVAESAEKGTRSDIEDAASALIENPGDADALEMLELEAGQHNAWGASVEVVQEAVKNASDAEVQKNLLRWCVEVANKRLKDLDKAQELVSMLLEKDPENPEYDDLQLEVLRTHGRYDEVVAKLAAKAEAADRDEVRLGFVTQIAEVYEENLKEYGQALEYWSACLMPEEPDTELLARLERLADKAQGFERLATATGAAAQAAEQGGHSDAAAVYYEKTGFYYIEKLEEPAFALTCYQKVYELRPGDVSALSKMADIYRGAKQWSELVEVLGLMAEADSAPSVKRDLYIDAARITYEKLEDATAAQGLLENVLSEDPAHRPALDLLADILTSSQSWDKLAKLLRDSLSAMSDGDDLVSTRLRLGELYEDRLDDIKATREQYEKASQADPTNIEALKGLERVFARDGETAALRDNLEKQLEFASTPKKQVTLMERLADIYEEEFKDNDKAISYLQSILETDGSHRTAQVTLARFYRKQQRWEELVDILSKQAATTEDEAEKRDYLQEQAKVLKEQLGDASRAAEVFAEVANLGDEDALEALARTQEEAQEWDKAAETLCKVVAQEEDKEKKTELLVRIAEIQVDELGDVEGALATIREAREMAPKNRKVAQTARKVSVAQGNYAAAIDAVEQELDLVEGPLARAELYSELGVLCAEHIKDVDRATKYFEQALELDENNLKAGDGVSTLYRQRGEWEKALPIYIRFADAADALCKEKRIELFTQMGEAYDHLDDRPKALETFARAADVAGDDPALVKRLGEVALQVGEYRMACEELSRYLDVVSELPAAEKVAVFIMLARAHLGNDDVAQAAKLARQATVMSPDNLDARLLLADVNEKRGDFRGMVEACQRVLVALDEDDERRSALMRRSATVLFEKLKDPDRASALLREALETDPTDRAVLGELLRIYSATKKYEELVSVVLSIADLVDESAQRARYLLTAAKIYRRELKNLDKALGYFQQVAQLDPSLIDATVAIEEVLTEKKDWTELERHYKRTIAGMNKETEVKTKLRIYEPYAELLLKQLGRPKEAIMLYDVMVRLDPENTDYQEKLAELYGWNTDYKDKAVDLHRLILSENPARTESFRALYHIYSADEEPDRAWCASSVLAQLNQASPDERSFYRRYQPEDLPSFESRLRDEHWTRLLAHPEMNQKITSIFGVVQKAILKLKAQPHSDFGVKSSEILDAAKDQSDFSGFVKFAAGALGLEPPPLFHHPGQSKGFELVQTDPPMIIAAPEDKAIKDRMGSAFLLGQQLTFLRPGLFVTRLVGTGTELSAWLLAGIKCFVPTLPVPDELAGDVSERLAPLRESLNPTDMERLQGYVQSFVASAGNVDLKRWARAAEFTGDRAGLLLCGDIAVAVRVLKERVREPKQLAVRLRELTRFAVDDARFELRKHLGVALRNG